MMMMDSNKKLSQAKNETLYSKTLLVKLVNTRSEEKSKHISITVDYQTTTIPTHKTELIIKLTDDQDPFFLYSLYMSEEDYQVLKCQQGLLVDFGSFGQKFVDLLNLCEQDEKSHQPKFQLHFHTKEPLPFDHNNANLNVVELNGFRHLTHLSLDFMPGNDADVKKYLATCLQQFKENYTKMSKELNETRTSLTQRLESTQQLLSNKNMDYDKLKVEMDTQSERLNTRYMQELNFEKEKALQSQYTMQQKYEKERKDSEQNFIKTQKTLETRVVDLEAANKDLLDKKYKNESQIQELRSKYTLIQEEYNQMKQDLAQIRKQNTTLDTELHTNEKTLNHLRTRIAVLEQEVKDKDEVVRRAQDSLSSEQGQKKSQDELLNEKNQEIKKLKADVKQVSQELVKGNEIIANLQAKLRACNSKMKLKNDILTEQEKVLCDKEKELTSIRTEFKETKEKLTKNMDENGCIKTQLSKKTSELEEAFEKSKKSEQMISWLNKQLSENFCIRCKASINGNGEALGPPQQMAQFRPHGVLTTSLSSNQLQNTAALTPRNITEQNCSVGNSSNSSSSASGVSSAGSGGAGGGILRSASATRNYNQNEMYMMNDQQPRVYSTATTAAAAATTTTTSQMSQTGVNTITTSVTSGASTTATSTRTAMTALNATQQSTHSTRSLDPKYFQPTSPIDPLNTNGLKSRLNATTNGSIGLSQQVLTAQQQQTIGGTRINKQLVNQVPISMPTQQHHHHQLLLQQPQQSLVPVMQNNNFLPSKSTPALASAYFPPN